MRSLARTTRTRARDANISRQITRRWFLEQCGVGLGAMALGALLERRARGRQRHRPIRLRRSSRTSRPRPSTSSFCSWPARPAIWICSTTSRNWRSSAASCRRPSCSRAIARRSSIRNSKLLAPKFKFARHGQSGAELSELLPHLATVVDDIAIVRSMVTDAFNHAPGQILMNTGSQQFGRPSIGAWATYGLGSESRDLPGFVVFNSAKKGTSGGASNWGCGFLPTVYQGVPFRSQGDPVLFLSNPPGIDAATAARLARRARASSTSCGWTRWAIRKSPRGSTRSRWPTGCRPARRS